MAKEYFFRRLDRREVPSLGFLIYQIKYQRNVWDDYEYIGKDEPKKLLYRSGLSDNLVKTYSDETKWWSKASGNLRLINGADELSLMTLDIDQFN